MRVADLHEQGMSQICGVILIRGRLGEIDRRKYSAGHHEQRARAAVGHAFQRLAPGDCFGFVCGHDVDLLLYETDFQ
jgi:hypothetical protein